LPTEELFGNYHFLLDSGSKRVGRSASIEGIPAVGAVIPGRVTLKLRKMRIPATLDLRGWWDPKFGRPSGSGKLSKSNAQGQSLATWSFRNAYPVKWTGPELDATKNEVAIETLEIAFEGLA
jgi:hypothetical protein